MTFHTSRCFLQEAAKRGSMCPTLMLTGLPESKYTQHFIASLVWPYFSKRNLHSLYYNVIVLPLQRRVRIESDESKWQNKSTGIVSFLFNPFILFLSPLHLQAFVFFPDWSSCCSFVRSHIARPVYVKDTVLYVHFVLQDMHPESTEVGRQPSVLYVLKSPFRKVSFERGLDAVLLT